MAELSPDTQAVLNAAHRVGRDRPFHYELDIAAAVRAAAERLEATPGQSHQVPGITAAKRQLAIWADELQRYLEEQR